MIHLLHIKLKKNLCSENFFKFSINYFFSDVDPTTNKLDNNIPVTHFYYFKYRCSNWYSRCKQI